MLVANGGRLPAGITLLREAHMDDGVLDVAVIDTVGGVAGWSSLARQVLPPFAATYSDPGRALGRVTLRRGTEAVVRLAEPALVQVDGELLAPTRALRVRMDAGALLVPHDPDEAGDGVGVVGHAPGQHLRLRRDPEGAPLLGADGRDAAPAAEGTGDGNNQVLPDRRKG